MTVTQQSAPTFGGVEQVLPPQTLHDAFGQQNVPARSPCSHLGSGSADANAPSEVATADEVCAKSIPFMCKTIGFLQ